MSFKYLPNMEQLDHTMLNQFLEEVARVDFDKFTAVDVREALKKDYLELTPQDFAALLSPVAADFLEEMAQKAQIETRKRFGNTVCLYTPLYIANYCANNCIYCGYNCKNKIHRGSLSYEEIEEELKSISATGLQEILLLTGEHRVKSSVEFIAEACRIARKYFTTVGIEVYPMNSDEYRVLHEAGADFVSVYQETYNTENQDPKKFIHTVFTPRNVRSWAVCAALASGLCLVLMISEKTRLPQVFMRIWYRKNILMPRFLFPVLVFVLLSMTIPLTQKTCMKGSFCKLCAHTVYLCLLRVLIFLPVNVHALEIMPLISVRLKFPQA